MLHPGSGENCDSSHGEAYTAKKNITLNYPNTFFDCNAEKCRAK